METNHDTIIIGAGIAGLTAARLLGEAGVPVVVLEKARGVGGRMATRRIGAATFDHGAQFVSVRDNAFGAIVREWVDSGVAQLWCHGFADGRTGDGSLVIPDSDRLDREHMPARDGHPRYRGAPGMTAIAKHAARGIDVRLGVTVRAVAPHPQGGWRIESDMNAPCLCRSVVLTAPVPQALALLHAGGTEIVDRQRAVLEAIDYDPCIAMLALLGSPVELPDPGVLRQPVTAVDWIADNQRKGVSDAGPALTVHGSAEFSTAFYDQKDADIAGAIAQSLEDVLSYDVAEYQIKRWRFSRPRRPLSCGAFSDGMPAGLVLAGDAFAGARVEGAVISGVAAAGMITSAR